MSLAPSRRRTSRRAATRPASRAARPAPSVAPVAIELDAAVPFHVLVADVQRWLARGRRDLVVAGPGAAAVASRLLRLLGGAVDVVVRLDRVHTDDDAARVARDAVALAGIAGGRAAVEVRDPRDLALVLDAVREALRTPPAIPTRFGGDAFTATIRLPWPVEVDVRVPSAARLPSAA
ncbi:hypothetical protein EDD28_0859 [Salana multivorans]|uniref:Uncharacterized protein n=1 Tax=Salana multivorans TaxID=120377 RepID=A0A3N2D914_9MICO|nr:hypothetical protein [Salana multivorans]ROR96277.1 hypothetical protein EDD28_0859 [Salana multivorans]